MLVTFSTISWKILFDLVLQLYLAVPWLRSQSRGVFWFLFIAVMMLGVYVVPASKDLGKWDRLCLINHHNTSLMREKEPWRGGRVCERL